MSHSRAFTLAELLAALAILSILYVIAMPTIQYFVAQNQVDTVTNRLLGAIHFARSYAINHGVVTRLCKSSDHKTCGGHWRDGQIVLDANEKLIRVFAALPDNGHLNWNSSLGRDHYLDFSASGFTDGQKGSFYYCTQVDQQIYLRRIIVEQSGRIRVEANNDATQLCEDN